RVFPVGQIPNKLFRREANHDPQAMAQCGIKQRTRRGSMRNSDGIEAVRSHLRKISLNALMIPVLPSLFVWSERSVSDAFDVELLIALEEKFSTRFEAYRSSAGVRARHDCGDSHPRCGFQHSNPLMSSGVWKPI